MTDRPRLRPDRTDLKHLGQGAGVTSIVAIPGLLLALQLSHKTAPAPLPSVSPVPVGPTSPSNRHIRRGHAYHPKQHHRAYHPGVSTVPPQPATVPGRHHHHKPTPSALPTTPAPVTSTPDPAPTTPLPATPQPSPTTPAPTASPTATVSQSATTTVEPRHGRDRPRPGAMRVLEVRRTHRRHHL